MSSYLSTVWIICVVPLNTQPIVCFVFCTRHSISFPFLNSVYNHFCHLFSLSLSSLKEFITCTWLCLQCERFNKKSLTRRKIEYYKRGENSSPIFDSWKMPHSYIRGQMEVEQADGRQNTHHLMQWNQWPLWSESESWNRWMGGGEDAVNKREAGKLSAAV